MSATQYGVLDRDPPHAAAVASLRHFTLGPGVETDAVVALRSGWSLYSLELQEPQAAVFVQTDGPLDLTGQFVYQQQRDRAQEVLVVPLEEFLDLADGVAPPDDLAFLFSTGRCGSTLASRIMATLPGVASLSEPDVYNNIAEARSTLAGDEVATLLRTATAMLCHGLGVVDAERVVIKPRSEAVLQEEVYSTAFPGARHAFMYRDVLGVASSAAGFGRRVHGGELPRVSGDDPFLVDLWNLVTANEPLATLGRLVDLERTDIGLHELTPTVWALKIRAHLAACERGDGSGTIGAVHYDDLVADRATETARLLAACGLDEGLTPRVLAVFERDSHAGMVGANDSEVRAGLDDVEREEIVRQLPGLGLPTYEVERL